MIMSQFYPMKSQTSTRTSIQNQSEDNIQDVLMPEGLEREWYIKEKQFNLFLSNFNNICLEFKLFTGKFDIICFRIVCIYFRLHLLLQHDRKG